MSKPIFDFLISFLGLIFLSPILFFTGVIIKLLMPGPVFFIQYRVGLKGKVFRLIKFRTMSYKANANMGEFSAGDKSRITKTGKVLRKIKIDEFPQFINVLKGEMSIVGPRPEVKKWTEVYPEKWAIVHTVKPGITDNASIEFRNEEELLAASDDPEKTYRDVILPRKLELYIDYVNKNSLYGDIKIIFQTVFAVIFR